MAESVFDGAPSNPFEDIEVPETVDQSVSFEMFGSLVIDADGRALFKSEQGPNFPVASEPISVSATIVDGVAEVTSIVIDDVGAAAAEKAAIEDVAIEMIDAHYGVLAAWLAENMPGEIERMSPSESMVDLVIRKLAETLPPVDGRGFVKDSASIMREQEAKRRRYGV